MIVLDTNVVSECMRPAPQGRVIGRLALQPCSGLFTTTVVEGEILYGIRVLPDGARRDALLLAVRAIFAEDFADREFGDSIDISGGFWPTVGGSLLALEVTGRIAT